MSTFHAPVLCKEVLGFLLTRRDGVYVDGTIGGGGHAEQICQWLNPRGNLFGFDVDGDAIEAAGKRLARFGAGAQLIRTNFRNFEGELRKRGVMQISGALFDLGVSSFQLDAPGKGFSFRADETLDMRMDQRQSLNAREVINTYPEDRLRAILEDFGEEREASRIAKAIVASRPLDTSSRLKSIIEQCVEGKYLVKSLARVFQALRIEVNSELSNLKEALGVIPDFLEPGGRCVVISYHSLEDRIVKQFFRAESAESVPSGHKYLPDLPRLPRMAILTRKPTVAGDEEISNNPRARSAKLRAAMRLLM